MDKNIEGNTWQLDWLTRNGVFLVLSLDGRDFYLSSRCVTLLIQHRYGDISPGTIYIVIICCEL